MAGARPARDPLRVVDGTARASSPARRADMGSQEDALTCAVLLAAIAWFDAPGKAPLGMIRLLALLDWPRDDAQPVRETVARLVATGHLEPYRLGRVVMDRVIGRVTPRGEALAYRLWEVDGRGAWSAKVLSETQGVH